MAEKRTPPIGNVIFLLLGLGMVYVGLSGAWSAGSEASDLGARGQKTTATCQHLEVTGQGKQRRMLAVTLAFKAADGPHTATVTLPADTNLYPNQKVDLVYDPQHPEVVSLPAYQSSGGAMWTGVLIALLGGVLALAGIAGLAVSAV